MAPNDERDRDRAIITNWLGTTYLHLTTHRDHPHLERTSFIELRDFLYMTTTFSDSDDHDSHNDDNNHRKELMNDDMINVSLMLQCRNKANSNVFIVPTTQAHFICQLGRGSVTKDDVINDGTILPPLKDKNLRFLVIPCSDGMLACAISGAHGNSTGMHWGLLIIDKAEKTATWIDPLIKINEYGDIIENPFRAVYAARAVLSGIHTLLDIDINLKEKKLEMKILKYIPHQNDNNSLNTDQNDDNSFNTDSRKDGGACGPYMFWMMEYLYKHEYLGGPRESNSQGVYTDLPKVDLEEVFSKERKDEHIRCFDFNSLRARKAMQASIQEEYEKEDFQGQPFRLEPSVCEILGAKHDRERVEEACNFLDWKYSPHQILQMVKRFQLYGRVHGDGGGDDGDNDNNDYGKPDTMEDDKIDEEENWQQLEDDNLGNDGNDQSQNSDDIPKNYDESTEVAQDNEITTNNSPGRRSRRGIGRGGEYGRGGFGGRNSPEYKTSSENEPATRQSPVHKGGRGKGRGSGGNGYSSRDRSLSKNSRNDDPPNNEKTKTDEDTKENSSYRPDGNNSDISPKNNSTSNNNNDRPNSSTKGTYNLDPEEFDPEYVFGLDNVTKDAIMKSRYNYDNFSDLDEGTQKAILASIQAEIERPARRGVKHPKTVNFTDMTEEDLKEWREDSDLTYQIREKPLWTAKLWLQKAFGGGFGGLTDDGAEKWRDNVPDVINKFGTKEETISDLNSLPIDVADMRGQWIRYPRYDRSDL